MLHSMARHLQQADPSTYSMRYQERHLRPEVQKAAIFAVAVLPLCWRRAHHLHVHEPHAISMAFCG